MYHLPYEEIWLLDTEYIEHAGGRPDPVCLVAIEARTRRTVRLWRDQLQRAEPPFRLDSRVLFVAYNIAAELGVFLALGWPFPARMLDLYVEFALEVNGIPRPNQGRSLLDALSAHGIMSITKEQKDTTRQLVLRGGPWTPAERREVLAYCEGDVTPLLPLLERMLPTIEARRRGLVHALIRGRYMAAVARMHWTGVPIDTVTLARLRQAWEPVKLHLVERVNAKFGVFDGTTFKSGLFVDWLIDNGIAWPTFPSGQLRLDDDTFKDMVRLHPDLEELRGLRASLSGMRLTRLAVGPDGRNRTSLFPFGAETGRNTPKASEFIFGPAVWMRGLIKPGPGRALAYLDWSSQEVWIAAVLSGDRNLLDSVSSGDPYLAFAVLAGLAPPGATKESHRAIRDLCKTCVLANQYGRQAAGLAVSAGIHRVEAQYAPWPARFPGTPSGPRRW